MRSALLSLTLLLPLLCACGGAGGAGGDTDLPAVSQPPAAVVQWTEDRLNAGSIDRLLELLGFLGEFTKAGVGGGPQYFVTITNANAAEGWLDWEIDLDGFPPPELEGRLSFRDAAGAPGPEWLVQDLLDLIAAFSLDDLETWLQDFDAWFASIPDGTVLTLDFSWPTAPQGNGTLETTYQNGAPANYSGNLELLDALGRAYYEYQDVTPADLQGPYPVMVVDFILEGTDATAEGSITFDGTRIAVLLVTVEYEGEIYDLRFLIYLDTGDVVYDPDP